MINNNSSINIQSLLQHDLLKLCNQIGIRFDEIPKLEFNKLKMLNLLNSQERYSPQSGFGRAYQRELDKCQGLCSCELRTIYVEYNEDRNKKQTYNDLYKTLVHELVHYRFPKTKQHDRRFYTLFDSILENTTYPEVNLFP